MFLIGGLFEVSGWCTWSRHAVGGPRSRASRRNFGRPGKALCLSTSFFAASGRVLHFVLWSVVHSGLDVTSMDHFQERRDEISTLRENDILQLRDDFLSLRSERSAPRLGVDVPCGRRLLPVWKTFKMISSFCVVNGQHCNLQLTTMSRRCGDEDTALREVLLVSQEGLLQFRDDFLVSAASVTAATIPAQRPRVTYSLHGATC